MSAQNSRPLPDREDPIPVLSVSSPDHQSPPSTPGPSRHRLSATKLKNKLESIGDNIAGADSPSRVSDRLFTMLLSNVLPNQDINDGPPIKDRRSREYVDRTPFSLPVMSTNFRRFNARIGVAFIFQNQAIRLFTWRRPTQTLSFLFIYTFICIDPTLLAALPLLGCLFFIMVPSFLARHPPPPTHLPTDLYPLSGPPLAAAQTIRPAPELSKDFFRNMRDLQNCMEDFSTLHDACVSFLTPLTNFSNEALSSLLYLLLLATAFLLLISAHLLPWRAIALVLGYAAVAVSHPTVQAYLSSPETTALLAEKEHQSRAFLLTLSKSDIELATSQESREVEIFELQHRALHDVDGEYEPYLFSPSTYAPLSPARVAGERPRGTPFFEDVRPPSGWRWTDKKWMLDLMSREWVEERCVTAVEVEMEGERWVTDLHYEVLEDAEAKGRGRNRGSTTQDLEKEVLRRTWESQKLSRKGEWRRRRWVRGVERTPVGTSGD